MKLNNLVKIHYVESLCQLVAGFIVFLTSVNSIPLDCRKLCSGATPISFAENTSCRCFTSLGDISVSDQQFQWIRNIVNPSSETLRGGAALTRRWNSDRKPNGFYRIPFYYSDEIHLRPSHVSAINKALSLLNALTCLRFEPTTVGDVDKIEFTYGRDCSSKVGKQGGTQQISVGRRCDSPGIVLHEVLHALGFWHEQSRHDRDDYVKILFNNVKQGSFDNFFKKSEEEIETFGSPYDLQSIMHYGSYAFTKNVNPTILKVDTNELIKRQRHMLSAEDQFQTRAMYDCGEVRGIPETSDCMHPLDRGSSYRGRISTTASGITCQRWDTISPHEHSFSPARVTGAGLEKNYCRNPDLDDKPWCYTTNEGVEWAYCNIPVCEPQVPVVENPKPLQSIPGFWSDFNTWTDCSVTCGKGTQVRTRHCIGSEPGSDTCMGKFWERRSCNAPRSCTDSQVTGNWLNWSAWSSCSASCGHSGRTYRVRACSTNTATCRGDVVSYETCESKDCPVYTGGSCFDGRNPDSYQGTINIADGKRCLKWNKFASFLENYPKSNLTSNFCRNPTQDSLGPYCYTGKKKRAIKRHCNVPFCQNTDAVWGDYGTWSSCSVGCGSGFKYRVRICQGGSVEQGTCTGFVLGPSACNTHECIAGSEIVQSTEENSIPATVSPVFPPPTEGIGCAEVGNPKSYRGTASTTFSGLTCQHWSAQYPHSHNYTNLKKLISSGLSENYCRAPEDDDKWPWCFAVSYDIEKQYCDIPQCKPVTVAPVSDIDCYDQNNRQSYRGSWSTTISGLECQRWDGNYPHPHDVYKPFMVTDVGLGPHNYCRNPDNDVLPWCISTDPNTFWEYCSVPLC